MTKPFAAIAGLVAVFLLSIAAPAAAADLTEDAARRFVASLDTIDAISAELSESDKAVAFDPFPKKGEKYAPYTQGIETLKSAMPDLHKRLAASLKKHDFTPREWAETGDKVMLAYMGLELDKQGPEALAELQSMDPAMLSQMPPQFRTQIERAFAMFEAAADAPAADKKALEPVMAELAAYMEREAARP